MYGTLQVIDVSDIEHPKSVAWYTPENGGVHNVWVVGDTLYIGAYDAGLPRVRHLGRAARRPPRAGARDGVAQHGRHERQHEERGVHVGRRREPEGRARVRERLQQRACGSFG